MKTVGCFCVYTRDCPPGNGVELAKCGGTQGCPSQRKYKAHRTLQRAQRGTVQTQLRWQTVKAMRHTSFTPSSPTHNGSLTWIQRTRKHSNTRLFHLEPTPAGQAAYQAIHIPAPTTSGLLKPSGRKYI